LKDEGGETKQVCKKFFLNTFGLKAGNDFFVRRVLEHGGTPENKKAKVGKWNTIDKAPIIDHINSFKAGISHYRRQHAPKRLYLSSDLNITAMHKSYPENDKVSFEVYKREVRKQNISFAKLGNEECELCEGRAIHMKEASHQEVPPKGVSNVRCMKNTKRTLSLLEKYIISAKKISILLQQCTTASTWKSSLCCQD